MNKATVNNHYQFDIDVVDDILSVNGEQVSLDSSEISPLKRHLLFQNKSFSVEMVNFDKAERMMTVKVNENVYQVKIETKHDLLLKKLGIEGGNDHKVLQVKAPMPGLVLNVMAAEGQQVKKGDSLLVLEAMKMENVIKSPTDGIIKSIKVKRGDAVEKNAELVSFV